MSRSPPPPTPLLTPSSSIEDAEISRSLFDAIPYPIFVKDDRSRFLMLNHSMCAFMGHSYDELIGKTDYDFVPKEHADEFRRVDRLVLETGQVHENEELIRTPDGETRTLVTRKARVALPNGTALVVGCITDVTVLKQREAAWRQLFEGNPIPMWVYETASLRFLAVNQAAIDHYGYTREQFLAKSLLDIRPQAEIAALREVVGTDRRTYSSGRTWRHIKADGSLIDIIGYSKAIDYDSQAAALVAVIDVTERKRAQEDLRRAREFLNTVIENIPVMLYAKDAQAQRYVLMNRAGEDLLGIPRTELIGKTDIDLFASEVAETFTRRDRQALDANGDQIVEEEKIPTRHRGERDIVTRRLAVESYDGKSKYVLAVAEDVTERNRDAARIAYLATHDALTDLPNRKALVDHLEFVLERATSGREAFALLRIALEGFKEINDAFGPAVADALLRKAAELLRTAANKHFVARTDGGEFSVVVVEGPHTATAVALAESLLAAVTDTIDIDGHTLRVGLSIGIAFFPQDATDVTTLLGNAHAALERARAGGGGLFQVFEADMDRKLRERRSLEHDLRSALAAGEISLHYQPQALIAGEIVGFEALIRWAHKQRGMVPPPKFIPVAEESGLIAPIGEWVLREACREAASWPTPLQVAVNLSPIQLRQGDFPELAHSILRETGLSPARLELEVTENLMFDDFPRASSILRRLKSLGVKIALDDFGTGYSSLSYLHAFPFDKIKIDKSFVSSLGKNAQSSAIIRAVIGLGRGLSMQVIAEGIETVEQLRFLTDEGCNAVQGFLIGKPHPIEHYAKEVGRAAPSVAFRRGRPL